MGQHAGTRSKTQKKIGLGVGQHAGIVGQHEQEWWVIMDRNLHLTGLFALLNEQASGKSVLIVGHSNAVLETIEAFGGERPVKLLTDDDYDYLFKIELEVSKPTVVRFYHFGQYHRGGTATMNVNSCDVDPPFLHDDPPKVGIKRKNLSWL